MVWLLSAAETCYASGRPRWEYRCWPLRPRRSRRPVSRPKANAKANLLSDLPEWEGENYPNHPDPRARTVNNLKFIGLAMHKFTAMNGGRLPAAAIRKGDRRS